MLANLITIILRIKYYSCILCGRWVVNVDDLTCWILAHKKKNKKNKTKKSQGIKENDYVTHLQYIYSHILGF